MRPTGWMQTASEDSQVSISDRVRRTRPPVATRARGEEEPQDGDSVRGHGCRSWSGIRCGVQPRRLRAAQLEDLPLGRVDPRRGLRPHPAHDGGRTPCGVGPPSRAGGPQASARVERPSEREPFQLRCAYAARLDATPNPAPATTTMASNTAAILWLLLTACTRRHRWTGPSDPVGARRLRIVGCCLHPPRRTRRSRCMFHMTV